MSARKNMSLRHPLTNKSLCNLKVKRKQGLEAKKKKKATKVLVPHIQWVLGLDQLKNTCGHLYPKLEISHDESLYTTEISKCYKSVSLSATSKCYC